MSWARGSGACIASRLINRTGVEMVISVARGFRGWLESGLITNASEHLERLKIGGRAHVHQEEMAITNFGISGQDRGQVNWQRAIQEGLRLQGQTFSADSRRERSVP